MTLEDFIFKFERYDEQETCLLFQIFSQHQIDIRLAVNFYDLLLKTKELCYKYNAFVLYEPFEINDNSNWEFFVIKNKKEVLLQVYYTSFYDLQQIEDNLSALYF